MRFKLWFETDVKAWQNKVNAASSGRDFAFASWFPPEGKVYLPFQSTVGDKDVDEDIARHFDKDHRYHVHDYAKGLLQDNKGRIIRIVKVLNQEEKEEAKRIQDLYNQKKVSDIRYQKDMEMNRRYFADLRTTFEASPLRRGVNQQSPYMVVITSTPEDIAGMSTNRDWTSCMDLSGGANRDAIWCELKNGGFVAYLCKSDDKNIDKPLARLHIRRFDNKRGQHIALPEDTIYGNEIQGFREVVQQWLDSKQGRIRPGRYVRSGGWYSDTFGSANPNDSRREQRDSMKHTILPKTPKGLFKLYDRILAGTAFSKTPGDKSNIRRRIVGTLLEPHVQLDDREKQRLVDLVRTEFPHYKSELFAKYPDIITPDDYRKAGYYDRNRMLRVKKDDPQYAELQKELVTKDIMAFDLNDPKLKINQPDKGFSNTEASMEISDTLRPLGEMGQLPEPLIRKVVHIGDQVMERFKDDLNKVDRHNYDNPALGTLSTIIHAFHMGHADTPTAINFFKRLLPYWDGLGQEHTLGIALGSLGRNGQPFLPFLKQKEQEAQDPRQKERMLYIIDAIENGTGRSDKYNFY